MESTPADAGAEDNAVSSEYKNALRAAQRYLDFSGFSEAKLYDQLTSEYGEQFSMEEAQHAVSTLGL